MIRVKAKQVSWRNAVNEKCKDCIYDEYGEGTWKAQVEACSMPDCPLYTIRPVTAATRKERAVRYQKEAQTADLGE